MNRFPDQAPSETFTASPATCAHANVGTAEDLMDAVTICMDCGTEITNEENGQMATKHTYISSRGNNDVRIMTYDEQRDTFIESKQYETISDAATSLFRRLHSDFVSSQDGETRYHALENAREDTALALSEDMTGSFDDETLTFAADCDKEDGE